MWSQWKSVYLHAGEMFAEIGTGKTGRQKHADRTNVLLLLLLLPLSPMLALHPPIVQEVLMEYGNRAIRELEC